MRKTIAALLLVFTAGTLGCGGSSSPTSPDDGGKSSGCQGNPSTGTLTATIDGVAWKPTAVTARHSAPNLSNMSLEVDSTDAACNLFGFIISPGGTLTTGTYQIGASGTNANYISVGGTPAWTAVGSRGSGTISLNTLTGSTATGTFNFVLVGTSSSKTVTNGTFNVSF